MQHIFKISVKMDKQYLSLRFRIDDGIHRKGDIQYVRQNILYIGQTPECELKLPGHPDYADSCYAVLKRKGDGSGWIMIRQNKDALINVNGIPFGMTCSIEGNDKIRFDSTYVQLSIEQGDTPDVQYVSHKAPRWMTFGFPVLVLLVVGILAYLYDLSRTPDSIFRDEIGSICRIEADTVFVLSDQNDTLEVLSPGRAFVGTGFITSEGYFVTARHCVEFWLGMEGELKDDFHEIKSDVVRKAIEAETSGGIRLVSALKIISNDGLQTWRHLSEDFVMDKTHDNIYECGDYRGGYLWRSVVSMYQKRDAELGDAAVMKWPYGKGDIDLGKPEVLKQGTQLCGFGYPQNEENQKAMFAWGQGNVYQQKNTADECFLCDKGFQKGYSGGPVFSRDDRTVVGIISRASEEHTLIVPVSRIHKLISIVEE